MTNNLEKFNKVNELIATGMTLSASCKKVDLWPSQYYVIKNRKKASKDNLVVVQAPRIARKQVKQVAAPSSNVVLIVAKSRDLKSILEGLL